MEAYKANATLKSAEAFGVLCEGKMRSESQTE